MASALLICPLHVLKDRIFPFVTVTDLTFFDIGGFIAGTTNPWLVQHSQKTGRTDLICDLETGKIQLRMKKSIIPASWTSTKKNIVADLDRELITKVISGIKMGCSEKWIREQFQNYTQHLIDMTFEVEYYDHPEEGKQQMFINSDRISKWKLTNSFRLYVNVNFIF